MYSKFAAAVWLFSLLPLAVHAAPGDSDLAQARELLALSQSSIKDYDRLTTQGGTDPALQTQFVNYVTFAREALPALRRSADEGNPAGQYLLAMTLRVAMSGDSSSQEEVCAQLALSAGQYFLPAVVVAPSLCPQRDQADVENALVKALGNASRDAGYYPMPSPAYRLCGANQRASFPFPELSQKEFEVDAYYDLAKRTSGVDRASLERKLTYFRAAGDRGCELAAKAVVALESRLK
jgi:hypothetical protein